MRNDGSPSLASTAPQGPLIARNCAACNVGLLVAFEIYFDGISLA